MILNKACEGWATDSTAADTFIRQDEPSLVTEKKKKKDVMKMFVSFGC